MQLVKASFRWQAQQNIRNKVSDTQVYASCSSWYKRFFATQVAGKSHCIIASCNALVAICIFVGTIYLTVGKVVAHLAIEIRISLCCEDYSNLVWTRKWPHQYLPLLLLVEKKSPFLIKYSNFLNFGFFICLRADTYPYSLLLKLSFCLLYF